MHVCQLAVKWPDSVALRCRGVPSSDSRVYYTARETIAGRLNGCSRNHARQRDRVADH